MSGELTNRIQRYEAVRAQPIIARGITSLVEQGIAARETAERHHRETVGVMMAGFTGIANRIDDGFSGMSSQIGALRADMNDGFSWMSNQIGAMRADMNLGFARLESGIVESSMMICNQLAQINDTLNHPSRVKSQESYRKALGAHANGNYEESLKLALEAAEEYKIDPLSWYLAGELYRSGRTVSATGKTVDVTNPDKSVEMFEKAADLITPEAKKHPKARPLAAEIWFYLGIAYLVKAEKTDSEWLDKAQNALEESWNYSDKMLEARYNLARCKVFRGDAPGALKDLEAVILKDRWYSIKAAVDPDFDPIRDEFRALIARLREELYRRSKPGYDEIQSLKDQIEAALFPEFFRLLAALPIFFTEDTPYFDLRCLTDDWLFFRIKNLIQYQLEKEKQYPRKKAEYDEVQALKARVKSLTAELERLLNDLPSSFPDAVPFISRYAIFASWINSLPKIKELLSARLDSEKQQEEEDKRRRALEAAAYAAERVRNIIIFIVIIGGCAAAVGIIYGKGNPGMANLLAGGIIGAVIGIIISVSLFFGFKGGAVCGGILGGIVGSMISFNIGGVVTGLLIGAVIGLISGAIFGAIGRAIGLRD